MEHNYSKGVTFTATIFLEMLDEELTKLEKQHKTGKPYWRRLRRRKRVVQRILELGALYPNFKKIREELKEEFFK